MAGQRSIRTFYERIKVAVMKVGIIGLPQTGKKTLFQALTGTEVKEHGEQKKPCMGVAAIRDGRFDTLVTMYAPRKEAPAKVDFALLHRLERETIARGDIFRDIVDMDAICHVVRAFEDDAIYHAEGSVDALRDVEMVNAELILHDLLFIETRLGRIEHALKKMKDEKQLREKQVLEKLRAQLENEQPLRLLNLVPEEDQLLRSYPFITRKEMILALNIAEGDINKLPVPERLVERCRIDGMQVLQVSARVEAEIAGLESAEEKREFLGALDIVEPALVQLSRLCIKSLGLISFFTVGKDEVRQWLLRRGSSAPEAAGVIHSDLQRGFIRAEVMKYDELIAHRDEAGLKAAGKMYLKGKDYIVEDGDILNIRFKV